MPVKPILIFGYGNISRGDDALAPLLIERLEQQHALHYCGHPVRFLTEYQIQIEHILDMQGCQRVLLIDAHQALERAYHFELLEPRQETSYTTHGVTPSTLLSIYQQTLHQAPPPSYLLALQGEAFNLGENLSPLAEQSLQQAYEFCTAILKQEDFSCWDASLMTRI